MYIYGLALHTVSDMFAHSAYLIKDGKPTRIYHTTMDDDPKNEAGSVKDFLDIASSGIYDKSFKVGYLSPFIKAIDDVYYNSHKTIFDTMSAH